jgi:hypothetical protein
MFFAVKLKFYFNIRIFCNRTLFCIQKNADQKITTSPNGWNLIANGLKYEHDANTFNNSLGRPDIEIIKDGDIETKIVYLVKGHPIHFPLQYDGTLGMDPSFKQINYSENQKS